MSEVRKTIEVNKILTLHSVVVPNTYGQTFDGLFSKAVNEQPLLGYTLKEVVTL